MRLTLIKLYICVEYLVLLVSSQLSSVQEQLKERQDKLDSLAEQCQQLEVELRKLHAFQRSSELTVEAVKASNEMSENRCQKPLHVSPPLSLADDSGSNEDALGGIIDWQGVSKSIA